MLIAAPTALLGAQPGQHQVDPHIDRVVIIIEVSAVVEVMLIDYRSPEETLGAEDEVYGLTDRRLADIIAPDEQRMGLKRTWPSLMPRKF